MADAFQPRFVDLVRNYTTTKGMDDFVLGAAVNGFTGFTDALEVGERFYYSALGIDNPADTEVGRGTLLDGGVIGREPMGGTKTNFKTGTKAVALIAASEWFRGIETRQGANVKTFGAMGDSDTAASSGSDDTAAFRAAIDYLDTEGGGTLVVPNGHYRIDESYLALCANLKIVMSPGAFLVTSRVGGSGESLDEDVRNGSMFYSNHPSNSSSAANIVIEGGNIVSANAANVGAAFYDNCGSSIQIRDVNILGFKYGVIFDQTEIADVLGCNIHPADAGGACVWLVNKDVLKTGNMGEFTNRIGVHRCQLNGPPTVTLIQDDGGDTHVFAHNNYNGGAIQLRLSGAAGFTIHGGEFEASPCPIQFDNVASQGTGVGPAWGTMVGGYVVGSVSGGPGCACTFLGTSFVGGYVPVVNASDGEWKFHGCLNTQGGAQYVDSMSRTNVVVDAAPVQIKSKDNSFTLGAYEINSRIQSTSAGAVTAKLGNDGNRAFPFPVGAFVEIEQMTAEGTITLVADEGVTINGVTATSGQYQIVRAVKVDANSWETNLIVPQPIDGERLASYVAENAVAVPVSWADKIDLAKKLGTGVVLDHSAVQVSHTGGTSDFAFATITVPGNSLGANGQLVIEAAFSCTNNANNKSFNIVFGAVELAGSTVTTTTGVQLRQRVANRGAANSQHTTVIDFNSGSLVSLSQDTTADLAIVLQGSLASAADTIRLESYLITIYPKD